MSAVDSGDIHTGGNKLPHQAIVIGCFGGKSYHDAHRSPLARLSKERCRMPVQQLSAGENADRFVFRLGLPRLAS
jgi:hypothetical protein